MILSLLQLLSIISSRTRTDEVLRPRRKQAKKEKNERCLQFDWSPGTTVCSGQPAASNFNVINSSCQRRARSTVHEPNTVPLDIRIINIESKQDATMGIFRRRLSKNNLLDEDIKESIQGEQQPPPPAAPAAPAGGILAAPNSVVCTVLQPWQWLLKAALEEGTELSIVDNASELPTAHLLETDASPPPTPSNRRRKKKNPNSCSLRLEIKDREGNVIRAAHGNSEAFDGLEDKDELVRTLQRCRCEHLELSPPSRLVNWDVTKEECKNVVGNKMPTLLGNEEKESFAVLKEPMGSRGTGIFFVRNAQEIHEIIDEHKKEAMAKPNFLDDLIANKGRIPSWGK